MNNTTEHVPFLEQGEERVTKLPGAFFRKVIDYAKHSLGIYAFNTAGAKYYSFTAYRKNGKLDWTGGMEYKPKAEMWDFVVELSTEKITQQPLTP